jgi:hypothetical protein
MSPAGASDGGNVAGCLLLLMLPMPGASITLQVKRRFGGNQQAFPAAI